MRRRPRNGISTTFEAGTGFVELHGEVDISAVAEIEGAVLELVREPAERVVVDFAGASFVDSKAIEALMRAAQWARQAEVTIAAAGAGGGVERVLEVCGLDHAMPVYDSRSEALAAIGAPGAPEE